MALRKEILFPNGILVNHHKIRTLHIVKDLDVFITVASYAGGSVVPVYEETYNFSWQEFAPYYDHDTIMFGAYNLLKGIPMFAGAEDV